MLLLQQQPFGFVSRLWHLCDVQHLQTSWRALFYIQLYFLHHFFSLTVLQRMGKFVFRN